MNYESIFMTIAIILVLVTLFIRHSKVNENKKDIFRIITLTISIILGISLLFVEEPLAFVMFSLGFCVSDMILNV